MEIPEHVLRAMAEGDARRVQRDPVKRALRSVGLPTEHGKVTTAVHDVRCAVNASRRRTSREAPWDQIDPVAIDGWVVACSSLPFGGWGGGSLSAGETLAAGEVLLAEGTRFLGLFVVDGAREPVFLPHRKVRGVLLARKEGSGRPEEQMQREVAALSTPVAVFRGTS